MSLTSVHTSHLFSVSLKPLLQIPTLHLLSSALATIPLSNTANLVSPTLLLRINYLASKSKGYKLTQLRLLLPETLVSDPPPPFLAKLTRAAYPNRAEAKKSLRIMLVVNPFGGKSGAARITARIVKPILEAASWRGEGGGGGLEVKVVREFCDASRISFHRFSEPSRRPSSFEELTLCPSFPFVCSICRRNDSRRSCSRGSRNPGPRRVRVSSPFPLSTSSFVFVFAL